METFPFLDAAIEKAKAGHNILVLADGRWGAWLFLCIVSKKLGVAHLPPPVKEHRDTLAYSIGTIPEEESTTNAALGRIFILTKRKAREWVGRESLNISDVYDYVATQPTERESLVDWQERRALIKVRPSRFRRKVL